MPNLRILVLLLPAILTLTLAPPMVEASRVNILFIVADDLNCAIGPYGDTVARTPNLNRLAARGLVFNRAYCQQAVCNPSRSSFLTGLRPDKVGVDDLRKYFRATAPNGDQLVTLPQHFKNHEYYCQDIGKIFHNMGETQDRISWSIDEAFYKGTHAADTVFFNLPERQGIKKPAYKAPVTEAFDVPDTVYRDGQITRLVTAVLRDRGKARTETSDRLASLGSKPFFLAVGFWRPHLPFVAPKRYWEMYEPDQIPLPTPANPPQNAPAIALHDSREIRGYGRVPKDREWTEAEIRHFRHGYYASISFLDAQVGHILDALDSTGMTDQTIVVFTSDHGFHIGEHKLWGKTSNFELDARVPLIIASPEHRASHGKTTDALVELVDLFPTLVDLAGIEEGMPANLDGLSLGPLLVDPASSVKDAALTQHQQPFYGSAKNWRQLGRSIRTERWRYTEWESIGDGQLMSRELYDHEEDSGESRNLAGLPKYRAIVEKLSVRLRQHQSSSR